MFTNTENRERILGQGQNLLSSFNAVSTTTSTWEAPFLDYAIDRTPMSDAEMNNNSVETFLDYYSSDAMNNNSVEFEGRNSMSNTFSNPNPNPLVFTPNPPFFDNDVETLLSEVDDEVPPNLVESERTWEQCMAEWAPWFTSTNAPRPEHLTPFTFGAEVINTNTNNEIELYKCTDICTQEWIHEPLCGYDCINF